MAMVGRVSAVAATGLYERTVAWLLTPVSSELLSIIRGHGISIHSKSATGEVNSISMQISLSVRCLGLRTGSSSPNFSLSSSRSDSILQIQCSRHVDHNN